jgi:hypothetical protein
LGNCFVNQLARSMTKHAIANTFANVKRPVWFRGIEQRVYVVTEMFLCVRVEHWQCPSPKTLKKTFLAVETARVGLSATRHATPIFDISRRNAAMH